MDLNRFMQDQEVEARDRSFIIKCKIATTANSEDDDVFVTFPNGDDPLKREIVDYWRVGVTGAGAPRFPTRGNIGAVLELDTGELWLIY